MKKAIFILFIFELLIFIPHICYSWWNSSWISRKFINISESLNLTRQSEPIRIWLNSTQDKISDCGIVRVTECKEENIRIIECNETEIKSMNIDGSPPNCLISFRANLSGNSWKIYGIYFNNLTLVEINTYNEWSYDLVNIDDNSSTGIVVTEPDGSKTSGIEKIMISKNGLEKYNISYRASTPITAYGLFYFEDKDTNFDFTEPVMSFHWHRNHMPSFMESVNKFQIISFDDIGMKIRASGQRYVGDKHGNGTENVTWYIYHQPLWFELSGIANATTDLFSSGQWNEEAAAFNRPTVDMHKKVPIGRGEMLWGWNGSQWKQWNPGSEERSIDSKGAIGYNNIDSGKSGFYYIKMNHPELTVYCEADKWDWSGLMMGWSSVGCFELGNVFEPAEVYEYKNLLTIVDGDGGVSFWDSIRLKIENPLNISLGPEETYLPSNLSLSLSITKHIYINETTPITTRINYNETPLPGLNKSNFNLSLDSEPLNINEIQDYDNGTYLLKTKISSSILGTRTLKLRVNYMGETAKNTTTTILLTKPKDKVLIITNSDWENYIPAVTTKRPVLVYTSERKYIDNFVSYYQPGQIFQLDSTLTFPIETFTINSTETLMKIFFNKTDLVIPSNKEVAIASTMLNLPILIEPTEEAIEFLNPDNIYEPSSVEEVEAEFILKNPKPDYFILTNKEDDNSIFASTLAIKKSGFIILTNGSADNFKNKLISKLNLFALPDSYQFDYNLYLTLIGTPHFSVIDPVLDIYNDDGFQILTDSVYADVNDDEYLDLSVGRFNGAPEQVSYQIELSDIFEPNQKALMLSAYNMPGKYLDVMVAGGTMPYTLNIELELMKNGYNVTRLVEKRSEYDELNMTVLEELKDIAEKLKVLFEATYESFFSELLGGINQIILVARAGDIIMYSILEFDWKDTWQSIINLEPRFPRHLPLLNSTNVVNNVPRNDVIVYLSKGNKTHWFLPVNSTWYATYYSVFDLSELPFNSGFYYLRQPFGYQISDKIFERGGLATIGPTGNSYMLQSDEVAYDFFKNFDQPIGKALKETKNNNLELDRFLNKSTRIYKKEYYTETLIGEPTLLYDPRLDLKSSRLVECIRGVSTQEFFIEPEYFLVTKNDENFLIFQDADDYIMVENKPIIPLYKESLILPTNTEILDVSFEVLSEKNFDDVVIPVLIPDPEYFDNETFTGTFPEQFYWNGSSDLLDGRKLFTILFSPVVYSSDGEARVIEKIEVSIKYRASLDISRIHAMDTFKDKKAKIFFIVCHNLNKKSEVNTSLKIQTDEFEDIIERQFTLHPGLNLHLIKYKNTSYVGDYSVSMVARQEDIIAGPKNTFFTVREIPGHES